MYNLSLIADEVPHALVPGFELEDAPVAAAESAIEVEEEPVVAAKPKAKVAISLGDDDDDDDDFVSAPVAKKAAPRTADASLDDLMSLADDLLGD